MGLGNPMPATSSSAASIPAIIAVMSIPTCDKYKYGPIVTMAAPASPTVAIQELSHIIKRKSCFGVKPTASIIPNSRRRSMTPTNIVLKIPAATRTPTITIMNHEPANFIKIKFARSGWSSAQVSTATERCSWYRS